MQEKLGLRKSAFQAMLAAALVFKIKKSDRVIFYAKRVVLAQSDAKSAKNEETFHH